MINALRINEQPASRKFHHLDGHTDQKGKEAERTHGRAMSGRQSLEGPAIYKEALRSLRRVGREISATLDLEHILHLIVKEAMRTSRATRGSIVLREAASGELGLQVYTGYSEAERAHLDATLRAPEAHPVLAQVLRTNQSLLVPDAVVVKESQVNTKSPICSALVVPIFYSEALTGLILLESNEKDILDYDVIEFVEGLASQASIAIGNDQRYKEQLKRGELLRSRADQLALVLQVSQALRSDRPLEDILEEIAYAIQESVGFNLVLISVLEGNPPHQRRVAAAGIPLTSFENMRETRQPWSVIQEVMDEKFRISQSYYVPADQRGSWQEQLDVYDEESNAATHKAGQWHPQDLLLTPLIGPGGDTQGLLSVDQPRNGRVPDRATAEALEVFAGQAALAIENVRLVEALQHRADTLALFNEVNRSATAKLDLNEVLSTVVEMVPRLLECTYSSIFLLDTKDSKYILRAVHGSSPEHSALSTFDPGEGILGQVVKSGMPLALDSAERESHSIPSLVKGETGPIALIPLTTAGQAIGLLCVGRQEDHSFSPAELATLSALADQIAVAVENARLFDQVHRFSQELEQRVEVRTQALAEAMQNLTAERDRVETLYRITAQLSASLDLDRVLNRSLELVVAAVEAERASILMLNRQSGQLIYRAALGEESKLPLGGKPTRFSRDQGLAGWVIKHRQPTIVADIQRDPRWVKSQNKNKKRKYRSALVVPLLSGDQVLGTLLLFHTQIDYFNQDHLRLVKAASAQIANAIGNAELYNLIREQTEQLGRTLKDQRIEAVKSQSILEGVADGVMVADANSNIILVNAAAERILELPRKKVLGRMTNEMLGLYGSQAQDWMETITRWARQPEAYTVGEYLAAQLDTGDRIVSVHLAPVLMGDEFLGTVSVFRDVTANVEAEKAKSEFVSTVSHELRTPMTSIKGYADLLMMGAVGALTEKQRDFLSIIRDNTDRLTALVNELLDISLIESGKVELSPSVMSVEDVTDRVITTIKTRAQDKDLILRQDIPSDLPHVFADADRVTQILTNLIANACQYTSPGGEIVVSASVHDEKVYITVHDTGIGIAPENMDKIFSRFFRADDPLVQEVPGTGLGLAIVKSLVEMHGEQIWVESKPGVGSTFTFTVAIAKPELADKVSVEK
ncbi:MAG: hypothetical protein DRI77_00210 [Chloroflexi bacterium]|nr:MAG: hypothetical protein DRI77_00210 [Chloroflexota bacterium]